MGFFFESPGRRKINVISFVWLRVEPSLEDALDLREIRADDCVYPDLDHRRDRGRRHLAIDSSYRLILHTVGMIRSHLLDPKDSQAFQSLFGMVLTLLIALEFKHSLMVVLHHQRNVVQTRSVILIALLALVRKFIVLDLYQTDPSTVAALAGAALALGIVFWLVRSQENPDVMGERQETNIPS